MQVIISGSDSDPPKCRYMLKISAKPEAVSLAADSHLILGCSDGRLVVFHLNHLKPFDGKRRQS